MQNVKHEALSAIEMLEPYPIAAVIFTGEEFLDMVGGSNITIIRWTHIIVMRGGKMWEQHSEIANVSVVCLLTRAKANYVDDDVGATKMYSA